MVLSLKQVLVNFPGLITLLTWFGQDCGSISIYYIEKYLSSQSFYEKNHMLEIMRDSDTMVMQDILKHETWPSTTTVTT